jgi:hypothetical protein
MYEGDRNGPLTDCRCHSLEATSADIADREYSRQTCFEQIRSASERPLSGVEIFDRQIWSRLNKSVHVERNASV